MDGLSSFQKFSGLTLSYLAKLFRSSSCSCASSSMKVHLQLVIHGKISPSCGLGLRICSRNYTPSTRGSTLFQMRSSWSLPIDHYSRVYKCSNVVHTASSTTTTTFIMIPHVFLLCSVFLLTGIAQALPERSLSSRSERLSSRQSGPYNVTWPDSSVTWFTGQTYNVTWSAPYRCPHSLSSC